MIGMKQCEIYGGICPVCHVYAHSAWNVPSSLSGYAGLWFVLWWSSSHCSVSVHAPVWGAQSSMCVVLSSCVHVLALVMSSLVDAQSLISHHDWCMFGSVSYLIFSDKISSGVVVVCLSGVCCHIFSTFLFIWSEVNAYVIIITDPLKHA